MSSYPKGTPNYEGTNRIKIPKTSDLLIDCGSTIEVYMDFLEELSTELGRNFNYEFNEYHKKRLS